MTSIKSILCKPFHWLKEAWLWYWYQYRGKWYQRLFTPIASLFVFFFLYLGAVDIDFLGLFGKSPSTDIIQNPISCEASYIYSADGVQMGKFFNENRSPVTFDEISPYVIDALISTEDERFYQHHGIDYQGVFAAMKDMANGNPRGASTITQQLVKNLFKIRSEYSTGLLGKVPGLGILIMKSKEWITAIKIESKYSKKDILTLYLNTVDFGSNSFGIKTAARTYFKTTPQNITAEQAAVLVGLLKATTTYNPKVNPDKSLERRNVVLNNMYTHGKLTKQERDSLRALPLMLNYTTEEKYEEGTQYFREAIKDYLADWCKKNDINLYEDGLTIYTTIDSRIQRHAEFAVQQKMNEFQKKFDAHWRYMDPWIDERGQVIPNFIENIAKNTEKYKKLADKYSNNEDSIAYYMNLPHKVPVFSYTTENHRDTLEISTMDSIRYMVKFLHCGLVAMEPHTAYVKAWVGDVDFNSWEYDKVKALRQPGSTFKLFDYAAAFEKIPDLTPQSRYSDSRISMQVPDDEHPGQTRLWSPHNADGKTTGSSMTLRAAFARSVNTIAVKVSMDAGIDNIVDVAKKLGVKSKLEAKPALSLGASDISLLELTGAYNTIMYNGTHRDPILVTKVLDRDGNVIFDCDKDLPKPQQAVSSQTAYYMQQLLRAGMLESGGTSQGLWQYVRKFYDTELGGKTGTSSNHSDAWYVGCSPKLVAGVWVGGEYRCIHFRTGELGQGNRTAMPIYGLFMNKLLSDEQFNEYHVKFPKGNDGK